MHFPTRTASQSLPTNGSGRARPTDDVVYQVVTLAAILLVLGTLWVF
jgi:hypothetical protein